MSTQPVLTFGALLRRARLAAGLSQEELAERAHLSREAISALERGVRRAPRRETIDLLADALGLHSDERAQLEATARRRRTPIPFPTRDALSTRDTALHLVQDEDASPNPPEAPPPLAAPAASSAPSAKPRGVQIAALGAPHPPASGSLSASGALPPIQVGQILPSLLLRFAHGKRGTRFISGLFVVALLGGALILTGEPGRTLAGQHSRTLCLATDFPTTGTDAGKGMAAQDAAQLALLQNRDLGAGYTLEFTSYNDASATGKGPDPRRGAQNVEAMIHNPCILGMIGPLNSSMALSEMPIAANAGLVMISPAATNPGLTLRLYAQLQHVDFDALHPVGRKTNFFSIAPNDVIQGIVEADFAFDDLNAWGVYVVDDHGAYGEGLAGGFTQGFLLRGGTIVGTESVPFGGIERVAELANRIAATRPDAVFYAGATEGGGGRLLAQLTSAGYTGPMVGGDAIAGDPAFVQQAGAVADNTLFAGLAAPDLSSFTTGAALKFISDYHARYPGQGLDGYSANAYDAAMVLIMAIKNLIRAGRSVTRAAVIDQVQSIQYAGVTGPISFDTNGDIAHGVYSIFSVQGGEWSYYRQVGI